jgi:hypothetical protein
MSLLKHVDSGDESGFLCNVYCSLREERRWVHALVSSFCFCLSFAATSSAIIYMLFITICLFLHVKSPANFDYKVKYIGAGMAVLCIYINVLLGGMQMRAFPWVLK